MSALRPDSRNQNYMFAFDQLRLATISFNGALFSLTTSDVVCVFNDERIKQIKSLVDRIQLLFGDDPLFLSDEDGAAEFIRYYDLTRDFAIFRKLAKEMLAGTANPAPVGGAVESVVIDTARIGAVAAALTAADISDFVRQQTVYMIADGPAPVPMFDEIFVGIADLERTLAPGVRLAGNRWLFQHLTEILDLRVIDLFREAGGGGSARGGQRFAELMRAGGFSLNLNVGSVLTPGFKALDATLAETARKGVVIEFQKMDAFADIGRYFAARDHLHERGYRVALDGLSYLSLPFVDRAALGVDFLKVAWTPEMERGADGGGLERMRALVDRAEPARVILCRCDSPQAIECGRRLGISLFQGWEPTAMATGQPRRSA
jgi:hypothetical protein